MRSLFTYLGELLRYQNNTENQITDFIEDVRQKSYSDPQKLLKPILTEDKTYRLDNNTKRYLLTFEGAENLDPAIIYIKD